MSKDLQSSIKPKSAPIEVAGGWIGFCLTIFIFQMVVPYFFTRPSGGGINWIEVVCAGIAGMIGMALGRKLAHFLNNPKK
jgi:uncharacterized membrane protein YfcA